ncbi:hypothetical protein [Spirosoma sp. KUDC1026]|uniref:hypothetical protein n=1 Tax=Spirosoma sp. KUDC1026 TaxID=2745947 RepID=UPI00159BCCFF|nr:hypothetical protein [Spirosoma sp. KUDC1026]QKZ12855.1 hypothetical protein HU175_09520 [Spirosoma sp. KUDC1026]
MKRILFFATLLTAGLSIGARAQSNQSPVMQQSTSTDKTKPTSEPKPMMNVGKKQRARMATGLDTTLPKDRKQRRLRPDSLRRGGATKLDTLR